MRSSQGCFFDNPQDFRAGSWQNGFFADFYSFGPPDFFADLVAGFFSSFLWEKVPRKILLENIRQNPPIFIQQKSPTYFCRGAGPKDFHFLLQDPPTPEGFQKGFRRGGL